MGQIGIMSVENLATGTSLLTHFNLVAPANHRIEILEAGFGFGGTSSTAEPIDCRVQRQTTTGTGATTTGTVLKRFDNSVSEALTVAAYIDFSGGEPTAGDIVWAMHIHPQSGIVWRPPAPLILGGGDVIGLVTDAAASVNLTSYMIWRE